MRESLGCDGLASCIGFIAAGVDSVSPSASDVLLD